MPANSTSCRRPRQASARLPAVWCVAGLRLPALPTHTRAPPTLSIVSTTLPTPVATGLPQTSILDEKVCGDGATVCAGRLRPEHLEGAHASLIPTVCPGAAGRDVWVQRVEMSGCSGSRYAPLDQIGPYAMSRYIAGPFLSYYEMRQNNHRLWHADLRADDAGYLPAHKGCASTRAWRTRR